MKPHRCIAGVLLACGMVTQADERTVLQYDAPATDKAVVNRGKEKTPTQFGFMQTALPLGNGRLGAMFTGGMDTEHLLINDITLWMNAKRGMDEVSQSGTGRLVSRLFRRPVERGDDPRVW